MATAETWLLVAAEAREFDGIRARMGTGVPLAWPGAAFAREVLWNDVRWWLVANGPGPRLVNEALAEQRHVDGMVSTGYCGALDPALQIGDIVVCGKPPRTNVKFTIGTIHSADRVAVTPAEKAELRNATNAVAVDMESTAIRQKADEWGVPFRAIRVVSDTAGESLPLDFNRFRDAQGRFARGKIARAALARPFTTIPALLRLDKHCRSAGNQLGVFFADCRF